MASQQRRRPPRNIYTEEHAEREFQDFIQHARLKNLPIPENILPAPQATVDPSALKRQKHTPPEVCQNFLIIFVISISNLISPACLECDRR